VRRPGGRAAAYPWRGCRGIAGHRPRRPGGGERGKRPVAALPTFGWGAGASSAVGGGSWRSARSSPSTREACTWRRRTARRRWRVGRAGAAGEYRRPTWKSGRVLRSRAATQPLVGDGPRGEPGAGMTGTPGSEGGPGKRARRKATTAPRADPATGIGRTGRSCSDRRIHPPARTRSMRLAKAGYTDTICSAVSCTSTSELHERIHAPHGPARMHQPAALQQVRPGMGG
jgi:hypothetical protein